MLIEGFPTFEADELARKGRGRNRTRTRNRTRGRTRTRTRGSKA